MGLSLQKGPLTENVVPRTKANEEEIRILWDRILDILLERIHYKSISIFELTHLVDELNLLMRAAKGRGKIWVSVVDVALLLLKRDMTISELRTNLRFNESTLYRALSRLKLAGFATHSLGSGLGRVWTINRETCPVLYRACRSR